MTARTTPTMSASVDGFVTLRGGLVLPVEALRIVWALEAREIYIRVENADTLVVGPRRLITDADRAALKRWKPHVIALVEYCADVQ